VDIGGQKLHVDDRVGRQIPDYGRRWRRPIYLLSRHRTDLWPHG
jgi:hypothetical protein